jgi:pyruvate dehydrogenase (quinone)/pyruvate oxidase
MVFLGNPEYGVNFAPLDFVKFAEACGARGVHIDDPRRCADQMREALSSDGPAIIECVVDPHEPPMPAKVKKDQVTKLAAALRAGTPNRNRIAAQMVKDVLDEASFDASPGHAIPRSVGKAASRVAEAVRNRSDPEQPD